MDLTIKLTVVQRFEILGIESDASAERAPRARVTRTGSVRVRMNMMDANPYEVSPNRVLTAPKHSNSRFYALDQKGPPLLRIRSSHRDEHGALQMVKTPAICIQNAEC